MTNEEIVLYRLSKKALSPLHFVEPNKGDYCYYNNYDNDLKLFKLNMESLKNGSTKVIDRVYTLITLGNKYRTYTKYNKFQCNRGARRSAQDLLRLYINYFGEIDIFSIMRVLYKLSVVERRLNSYRCPNVRKQVFWIRDYNCLETNHKADLGVPLKDWQEIGLNNESKT